MNAASALHRLGIHAGLDHPRPARCSERTPCGFFGGKAQLQSRRPQMAQDVAIAHRSASTKWWTCRMPASQWMSVIVGKLERDQKPRGVRGYNSERSHSIARSSAHNRLAERVLLGLLQEPYSTMIYTAVLSGAAGQ